jgi:hypothetical protein
MNTVSYFGTSALVVFAIVGNLGQMGFLHTPGEARLLGLPESLGLPTECATRCQQTSNEAIEGDCRRVQEEDRNLLPS